MSITKHILPTIVLAQFGCTSLWFAGNAVVDDLSIACSLASDAIGHLTAAVQLGFIAGTLCFTLLAINDRFPPSKIFMLCASLGAGVNLLMISELNGLISLCSIRLVTGFCLAGIYPVGMKIAADYYQKGLGRSLGFLVGALVLGTAFPHLLNGLTMQLPWKQVIIGTSALAFAGGLSMLVFVPDGPHRQAGQTIQFKAISSIFQSKPFRTAAFGYFGHMWELYAFWTFVPHCYDGFWEFIRLWALLRALTIALNAESPRDYHWFFDILGYGGYCRLSPILHAYCSKCQPTNQRHCTDHRELHWLLFNHCEHSIIELLKRLH